MCRNINGKYFGQDLLFLPPTSPKIPYFFPVFQRNFGRNVENGQEVVRSAEIFENFALKMAKTHKYGKKGKKCRHFLFLSGLISSLFFGIPYFFPPPGGAKMAKIFTVVLHIYNISLKYLQNILTFL